MRHPLSRLASLATLPLKGGGIIILVSAAPMPVPVDTALLLTDAPAAKLSDYRLFLDTAAKRPNARVTPYALNTPLFSDYAAKHRFVFVPPGTTATYRPEGVMDFPVGTALVKTFATPTRFLETRLLIRKASGWVAQPYLWNAEGTEATLKRTGTTLDVEMPTPAGRAHVDWQVPNVNQCKGCHARGDAMTPIGPTAWNLGPARLRDWAKRGLLRGVPAAPPMVPRWDDASAPVAVRAKAYLAVNCAHCHNAAGPASNSGLFLDFGQPDRVASGIGKRPVAAGRGSGGNAYAIVPGRPDDSILAYRMASTEPGVMMPELGRTLVHREGLALVRVYIASLPPEPLAAAPTKP